MPYWVYILQSETTGRYYVGQTNDLEDRLKRHAEGRTLANRNRGPWRLVLSESFDTRAAAVQREREIKARKSRAYLERLRAVPAGENGPR